jgi:hypothetical protein
MRAMLRRFFGLIASALLGLGGAAHATALYTVGPDTVFTPRTLTALTTAGVPTAITDLGDGSVGFNGGLAYRPGDDRLYAAGTAFPLGVPQSNLHRLSTTGSDFTSVLDLTAIAGTTVAFTGGLAYRSGDDAFYLIANDSFGASSLFRHAAGGSTLESLGDLGIFGSAGLTYNADDDKLYVVASDSFGVPRSLSSITLGVTPAVAFVFDLGDGSSAFNGGLAYDDANNLFYVIANDSFANSSLDTFTLAGAGTLATLAANFGPGFLNASLTLGPAAPIPEPGSIGLLVMGLLGLAATLRRRSGASSSNGPAGAVRLTGLRCPLRFAGRTR